MVALVGTAGWLGLWQVDAWQARRTAEARDLTQLAPVPMTELIGNDDPFPAADQGRPVTVEGEWIYDATFWVSGREQGGREGYWAVTPLSVDGAGQPAVPVVLGWQEQPALESPTGAGAVTGWLQPPEGGMAVDEDTSDDIYPELRISDVVQRVDVDLYGAYVVIDQARTDPLPVPGLEPADLDALPEVGRFTAVRNLLYGVEWFIFGGFALFVWWRWLRDARNAGGAALEPTEKTSTPAG